MPEMSSATLFTFGLYGYKLISWWNIEPSTPRRQFELAQYYSSSEIREKPFRILAIELFPIRNRHYSTDFIRSETSCKVLQPLTSQWRNGAILSRPIQVGYKCFRFGWVQLGPRTFSQSEDSIPSFNQSRWKKLLWTQFFIVHEAPISSSAFQ